MRLLAPLFLLLCATAAHADKASIERYFQALDLNGDGYVSLAEAAGDPIVVQRFDKGDKNRDGKLSEKEFANLGKVKLRVAKARKDKGKEGEVSAAVGGTTPVHLTPAERKRQRLMKDASEAGG
jgi:EF hand